ncbi:MAG: hypothetical protein WBG46_01670 [Nonlabens sp.]
MKTMVYNKEDLHRHLEELRPEGYVMNKYGQFLKREENNDRTIMLTHGRVERFPFGVNFSNFTVGVTFHPVENIIHTVYKNHPDLRWGHDKTANTFGRSFSDRILGREIVLNNVYGVLVEDDASFARVRPHLQTMQDAGLDFLRQHESLRDFHNLAETMQIEEMAGFYSQPLPVRRITVYKLMGLPYDDMATALINKYAQRNELEKVAFVQDLKTYLDNL